MAGKKSDTDKVEKKARAPKARKPAKAKPVANSDKQNADSDKNAKAASKLLNPKGRFRFIRWVFSFRSVRIAAFICIGLVLAPFMLTLIYAIPGTKPISTLMLADLVTLQGYDRQWRNIDDISDNLKNSVIMSEDGQFCRHHGVDLGELKGVVQDALAGEETRGASTLTMQLAKNLFLWPGRSFVRKGLELPIAIYMDAVLSKRRIFELYLNVAEWGPDNIYGIEAATQYHFNIDADELSRRNAALLAVTLPNPHMRNPARPGPGLSRVAGIVERRARGAGDFVACLKAH